jgi:hypothetical protein
MDATVMNAAHIAASGGSAILYWIFFLLCWYVGASTFVALSRTPLMWRATGIALYIVAAVPAWNWYMTIPGYPHVMENILIAALPLVLVILFVLLSRMHRRRR